MDITNAILDPELGRSAFTVERLTYTRSAMGTTSRSRTYSALGCVHPGEARGVYRHLYRLCSLPGFRPRLHLYRSRPDPLERRDLAGGSGPGLGDVRVLPGAGGDDA